MHYRLMFVLLLATTTTAQTQSTVLIVPKGATEPGAKTLVGELRRRGVEPRIVLPGGSIIAAPASVSLTSLERIPGVAAVLPRGSGVPAAARPDARDLAVWQGLSASTMRPAPQSMLHDDIEDEPASTDFASRGANALTPPDAPETSEFLVGTAVVGVLFLEANGKAEAKETAWTETDLVEAEATVVAGLERFFDAWPGAAPFSFILQVESAPPEGAVAGTVATDYEPYRHANMDTNTDLSALSHLGIEAPNVTTARRLYVNRLRAAYGADWAVMVKVVNDAPNPIGRASSFVNGPQSTWFRSSVPFIVHHEVSHLFGALDEYCPDACRSAVAQSGYLLASNANSQASDGKGFFAGSGEGMDCVMINDYGRMCPYTRQSIGWWDSDGDGIPDTADTFADTTLDEPVVDGGSITLTGRATLQALPSERINRQSIAVGAIARVEARVDGGAWQQALADDGSFDGTDEAYSLNLAPLPAGSHLVEVRAVAANGNIEVSPARALVVIAASPVSDAPPVATLAVPARASIYGAIRLDAGASSDLEHTPLEARFDFDGDGTWDTDWTEALDAEHLYAAAGAYSPRVELKDGAGNRTTATASVVVAAEDLPPVAAIVADRGASFGESPARFALDASLSYDPEGGPLSYRWDLDGDGVFDASGTQAEASFTTTSSETYAVTLEVENAKGQTARSSLLLTVVPYDHPPQARLALVSVSSTSVTLSASASSDDDAATNWDGLLVYRWDFDSDGVYDTPFSTALSSATHDYGSEGSYTATVEVRDRFLASARASVIVDLDQPPRWTGAPGVASASPTACGILLAWSPATDPNPPVSYRVFRADTVDLTPSPDHLIATTTMTTFADATAPRGQTSYYIVRASDAFGVEDGNTVLAKAVAPTADQGGLDLGNTVKLVRGNQAGVELGWQPLLGASLGYVVLRGHTTDGDDGRPVVEVPVGGEDQAYDAPPAAGLTIYRVAPVADCSP